MQREAIFPLYSRSDTDASLTVMLNLLNKAECQAYNQNGKDSR